MIGTILMTIFWIGVAGFMVGFLLTIFSPDLDQDE